MEWKNVSVKGKNFIRKALVKSLERRPTAEEMLRDPWITSFNEVRGLGKLTGIDCLNNLRSFCVSMGGLLYRVNKNYKLQS